MSDAWQPAQYHRFQEQRRAPFFDLVGLLEPVPGGRVVDLGCGTGELTAELHRRVHASETLGLDTSPAMLEQARPLAADGLHFEHGDLATFDPEGRYDIVVSNAALQWVPDHAAVIARWTTGLPAGAQLAVQVPANGDHPSHRVAYEVAREAPFADALENGPPADPVTSVLRPEDYATLLHDLGYQRQHVRLQVYGHRLDQTADLVEWAKGTTLVGLRRALPAELYEQFLDRYRMRLLAVTGDRGPYFYAFKRILFSAVR